MLARLLLATSLLGSVSLAHADQEPSFILTFQEPVGGKPAQHKAFVSTLRGREAELKPAMLAKTKAHPHSRLSLKLTLAVQADGSIKPTLGAYDYHTADGDIKDESLKTLVVDTFAKTKKQARELKGATVEASIAILQP